VGLEQASASHGVLAELVSSPPFGQPPEGASLAPLSPAPLLLPLEEPLLLPLLEPELLPLLDPLLEPLLPPLDDPVAPSDSFRPPMPLQSSDPRANVSAVTHCTGGYGSQ
jgi:hypothetical protein